ncbi:MAG: TonB-dependent receptor plug domain-containing protein [Bacteroidota bacterium]
MNKVRVLVWTIATALGLFVGIAPTSIYGQLYISGNFQDLPLETVIETLEREYDLVFVYTQQLVAEERVTARFEQTEIERALGRILAGTPLYFDRTQERYFILRPRREEELEPPRELCGRAVGRDGLPLAFANVYLPRLALGTSADEEGRFRWSVRALPEDRIEISYVGYDTQSRSVSQLVDCPDILLGFASFSMPEVVVQEYVTKGIRQTGEPGQVLLRPREMNVVPGLTEADLLRMVELLPGIQSIDESATGLHIRGGTPDQNLILWDGIPVYNGGHFFGMISAFNPYIVEEVAVYRSDFGAEYGGRLAGVIDISSREKIPEKITADLGLNFTHADAAVTIPLAKRRSALTLSARRAYTDLIQSPTYNKLSERVFQRGKINNAKVLIDEGFPINDELRFVFNDLNLKWSWQLNPRDRIALSSFGIFDRLFFEAEEVQDYFLSEDQLEFSNVGISGRWDRKWRPGLHSRLTVAYTGLENAYLTRNSTALNADWDFDFSQNNTIRDFSLQWQQQWTASEALDLKWGYEYRDQRVERSWQYLMDLEEADTDENIAQTVHLTLQPHLGDRHRWHLGLRWNFLNGPGRSYWEPRFSWQYRSPGAWRLKAAVGQHYQFLSQVVALNDLELNQQLWVMADGESDIPVARGRHLSLGTFWDWNNWQLEVEGYHKRLLGLTSFSPVFLDNFREEFYAEGSGRVWGVDVLLKRRWAKYQTWLSYTYSRVWYTFDIYNNDDAFPAPHDRPHYLTTIHQLELDRWNLSLSWKLASGRAYTQAEDIQEREEELFPLYNFDRTNAERLPLYHRLDLSFLYRFPLAKGRTQATLGLSVLNVYNRENLLGRQYFVDYDDEAEAHFLETRDRPMLGITPNLVVRLRWK